MVPALFCFIQLQRYITRFTAKNKSGVQQLDHAAIYILIAGTYTPFALINLRDAWGWTLLGVARGIALLGVFLELGVKNELSGYRLVYIWEWAGWH